MQTTSIRELFCHIIAVKEGLLVAKNANAFHLNTVSLTIWSII